MKYKYFFLSLPFDRENSGDYNYCTTMVNAINKQSNVTKTEAEYVRFNKVEKDTNKIQAIYKLHRKYVLESKDEEEKFKVELNKFYNSKKREDIILKIKNYLDKDVQENCFNIINLQLRAPESGFLFEPNDLKDLKQQGFKIIITCHEYKWYKSKPWLQKASDEYFEVADLVFFFNKQDVPENFIGKHAFTRVPPTVENIKQNLPINELNKKPSNIITFGLIRGNKGFEEAIEIIKEINKLYSNQVKLIIVGNPGLDGW